MCTPESSLGFAQVISGGVLNVTLIRIGMEAGLGVEEGGFIVSCMQ